MMAAMTIFVMLTALTTLMIFAILFTMPMTTLVLFAMSTFHTMRHAFVFVRATGTLRDSSGILTALSGAAVSHLLQAFMVLGWGRGLGMGDRHGKEKKQHQRTAGNLQIKPHKNSFVVVADNDLIWIITQIRFPGSSWRTDLFSA
jgi:hypothetical protein